MRPTVENQLTPDEEAVVAELRARDLEVRAHEAAHAGVGGGTPTYTYQRGPDGRSYAVGGEVQIDASGGSTPQETIAKMQRVRAAALAPANPSGQDRSVAASASRRITQRS
ncbi:MAG: putative metalloprotease CJM1_0395 family protein, partial [Myxococcota bacterium]